MAAMLVLLFSCDGFQQELEDLDVSNGLTKIRAPGVQPVAADQEPVRAGLTGAHPADDARGPRHVLIVFDDGQPLAVLVRSYALEPLQHLVALDRQAARIAVPCREQRAPGRVRVENG